MQILHIQTFLAFFTRELYTSYSFIISDRLSTFQSSVAFSKSDIVFSSDTPKRQYMKKQAMLALKQNRDGWKDIESKTLLYGEEMLKTIEQYKGGPFDPGRLIHMTLAHMMLILIFGHTSDEDAAAVIEDANDFEEVLRPVGAYFILDIAPVLRFFVPPIKRAYTRLINVVTNTHAIYHKYIAARRKLYRHPKVEVFVDHFLKLNITNETEDTTKNINETDIFSVAHDIFVGGMATTSKTLTMMLAILVNHPNIQDAVYQEINDTIGRRQPKTEDKLSMPFTQAVILEMLRYQSSFPFAIPHRAKYDSMLQGYLIPAGTIIFPNLWALHHDNRYWENPWEFNPNRWLEEGQVVPPGHITKQRLLPFGAGKRQCPGEAIARNRLFLLVTMLLQKFKFVAAEGHQRPNHDPSDCKVDFILQPNPYKLSVEARH